MAISLLEGMSYCLKVIIIMIATFTGTIMPIHASKCGVTGRPIQHGAGDAEVIMLPR